MKNNVAGWILFALALPAVILGHLYVLLACLFWFAGWGTLRYQGAGVLTARWRPWFSKRFRYSTTLGRGICYGPGSYDASAAIDNRTEMHEFVHIKQFEDACCQGLALGALLMTLTLWWGWVTPVEGLGLWALVWATSPAWNAVNNLTGALRYGIKGLYRDAEHERSAYAQTDVISQLKADGNWTYESWTDLRDRARKTQQGIG